MSLATTPLAKLIRFYRFNPDGTRRFSERSLGDQIGVSQRTIRCWESGGEIGNLLEPLANFVGKTPDQLRSYLRGDCDLKAFLQGDTEVRRSRRLAQVLEWLPGMDAREVYEIVQTGFKLLSKDFKTRP